MDNSQLYQVNLGNLTLGIHQYSYKIDNQFFEDFNNANDLAQEVDCKVVVNCDRTETMTICNFTIEGNLVLQCDRSLKLFDYPIDIQSTIYYKFGNEYAELSEDLITISEKDAVVDFSQPIFDLLSLEVPTRKLHPDHREEGEEEDEYFFTTINENESEEIKEEKDAEVDPRWAALQKLKKS